MKKVLIASCLLLGTSLSGFAQHSKPKVIVLVNEASWCPVCKANGPRFTADIMPMVMQNKEVRMVKDDLSDAQTIAASMHMLKNAGIARFAKKNTDTGMLFFFNARSKKLISEISIAKSDDEIKEAFQNALSKG
ncbi:MAG TPA: hypothetical protein VNE41_10340 [Chitinophagaceae bacterium]|nr:hypothetical protein [Chitinophagaceae bacterium]